jgi:hypothetical protein
VRDALPHVLELCDLWQAVARKDLGDGLDRAGTSSSVLNKQFGFQAQASGLLCPGPTCEFRVRQAQLMIAILHVALMGLICGGQGEQWSCIVEDMLARIYWRGKVLLLHAVSTQSLCSVVSWRKCKRRNSEIGGVDIPNRGKDRGGVEL